MSPGAVEGTARVVALAGSLRSKSLNRRLLDLVVAELATNAGAEGPVTVDVIDLRPFPLPLYDGDLQRRDGIPRAAHDIYERVASADGAILAVPEYNGSFPALVKNTIDWVSRIDMLAFHPRLVGLASASPGKGGGARGLVHTAAWFQNMFVPVHEDHLTVPGARDALGPEGPEGGSPEVDAALAARLAEWATGYRMALAAHRRAKADAG